MTEELVELERIARSQAPTLSNLLELYVHDFSDLMATELGEDGRFGYPLDDRWWTDATHHPFFIRWAGKLCGFALVRAGSPITGEANVMDVCEFFVVRGRRRQGIGSAAAQNLLRTFPARWEIRVRDNNLAARQFWLRAFGADPPSVSNATIKGVPWHVLRVGG